MGLFYVKGSLTGPTGRKEEAELLVDTGATLLVVRLGPGQKDLQVRRNRLEGMAGKSSGLRLAKGLVFATAAFQNKLDIAFSVQLLLWQSV